MSKGNKSIKKPTNQSSLIPNVGAKNIDILHEATLSDTTINLQSINPPATATANGFVPPSNTELAAINLFEFRENVEIKTNGAVLVPYIDYTITNSQVVTLTTPATAAQVYHITYINAQKQGVRLVDARPLAVNGTLLDTQTDFVVGDYKVGDNINYQHGAVLVYRGQVLQLRNPANGISGGDYQEVAGIIRFNTPASGNEEVSVVSVGSLVESPNGSQMARLEEVQGQVDAMVPYLAIEASVPESTFQGAPNNPDLKAFGDKVSALNRRAIEISSGDSGAFQTISTTFVPVTNLSVTITTTGRPVRVFLLSANDTSSSNFSIFGSTGGAFLNANGDYSYLRDSVEIARYRAGNQLQSNTSPDNISMTLQQSVHDYIDFVPAGTYTYTFEVRIVAAGMGINVVDWKLGAYEI